MPPTNSAGGGPCTARRRLDLLQSKKDRQASLDWPDEKVEKFLLDLDQVVDLGDSGPYSIVAKKNAVMRMLGVGVDHSAVTVWHVIDDYVYDSYGDGTCFPSLTTIAKRISLSRRATIRWVNYLDELGALERVKRGSARTGATKYKIHTAWNPSYGLGIGAKNSDSNVTTPTKSNGDSNVTTPPKVVTPVTPSSDTK